jgi:hypothetical protein
MLLMENVVMRTDHLAPSFRSTIGFDRPFHLVEDSPSRPQSRRRRPGLRWLGAIHRRRQDDDDDPPPAPAAMRLAEPDKADAQREPGPALLWAA